MSEVLPAVKDNVYFGLVLVNLDPYWCSIGDGTRNLSDQRILAYRNLRTYVVHNSARYKFEWNDHGLYLPSGVYVDSEFAVVLKLKFGA